MLEDWDSTQKIKLEIDTVDSTLINFPILVNLTSTSGKNNYNCSDIFTTLSGNSKKIAIEYGNTGSQCYSEIERWDSQNYCAEIWVKVPTISGVSSNTTLYLYYDAEQADNTTYIGELADLVASNIWTDFEAVYHMNQDPSGSAPQLLDSTANSYDCTSYGAMTSADLVDGTIGKAIKFDGTDDYLKNNFLRLSTTTSISFEIDVTNYNTTCCILHQGDAAVGSNQGTSVWINDQGNVHIHWFSAGSWQSCTSSIAISEGKNSICVLMDNSSLECTFIINNATHHLVETKTLSAALTLSTYPLLVGAYKGSDMSYFYNHILDEIRICNTLLTETWANTTHLSNTDNLITFSKADIFIFNGYVQVAGSNVARTINLYLRSTGKLVGTTTSNPITGYFEIPSSYNEYHFVNILPLLNDNYNIIVQDKIHPNL
jgi:hypothetical protein